MNELDKKITYFGGLFKERLDDEMLQDAIGYVGHGERGLAFETICDHLSEYEVPISQTEYDLAITICNELKMDVSDVSLKHLRELIIR
ncbi:MafI family immunity protein [Serratia sp. UGAL515B_01]|uniref:MafI family immunity protein n=1 Tax=Serratia sp. UGAL515B_01 TaxID=2986763 RepID=UPI0029531BB7|nr:MafI family immunity protein [Serratia sp. UGAL515B_01]WON75617.1 MafI family immunity protein [Serratia sp. UGAL515B_01]